MIQGRVEGTLPNVDVDWTELMEKAAELMYESVMTNFFSGGRPVWQPLKTGEPSRLFQGGRMMGAIERQWGKDFAEVFISKVAVPYAFIHQFGGYAGRGHKTYIPPRPYMMFQPTDGQRIAEMLQDLLFKTITTSKKKQEFK